MSRIQKTFIKAFGDESQISVVTAQIDKPAASEVQIRVEYSPVSGADINMRKGTYPFQKKTPLTPGYSVIGRVEENGAACSRFKVGERVACLTVYDGQSELVNQPEEFLVPVPENVDPQQAAALVLDWTTAYQMVNRCVRLSPGQRVFIHGLSGSVGRALLTLAKLKGAEVYGTASPRNHDDLRKHGSEPFSYADKKWIHKMISGGGVDVVFDPLGFESFDESYSVLRKGGTLVAYGMNLNALGGGKPRHFLREYFRIMSRNLKFWSGKRVTFYGVRRSSEHYLTDLQTLMQMLSARQISVPIKAVFKMQQIREAHMAWATGPGMGTIVLEVQKLYVT